MHADGGETPRTAPLLQETHKESGIVVSKPVDEAAVSEPHALRAAAEPIESAPAATLVPGHFGGISVRHAPDASAKGAAVSAPGREEVITTASGEKLVRVTSDGRDDVPLAPPPSK